MATAFLKSILDPYGQQLKKQEIKFKQDAELLCQKHEDLRGLIEERMDLFLTAVTAQQLVARKVTNLEGNEAEHYKWGFDALKSIDASISHKKESLFYLEIVNYEEFLKEFVGLSISILKDYEKEVMKGIEHLTQTGRICLN